MKSQLETGDTIIAIIRGNKPTNSMYTVTRVTAKTAFTNRSIKFKRSVSTGGWVSTVEKKDWTSVTSYKLATEQEVKDCITRVEQKKQSHTSFVPEMTEDGELI